jgi:pimeloyl-ACP methyl ester carboxylesterase
MRVTEPSPADQELSFARPILPLAAAELVRAMAEFGSAVAALPVLALAARGTGRPVLVLPGLGGGDRSTGALRWYLGQIGYRAYGWSLGVNRGPSRRVLDGLERRLFDIADSHDAAVSLVGWSLGGLYARQLAQMHPDRVRSVITLASPFRAGGGRGSEPTVTLHGRVDVRGRGTRDAWRYPLAVPATSIFTRSDGVVPWRACLDEPGPLAENVEVVGSHFGLGHNPEVLWTIARRLASPPGSETAVA